MLADDQFRHRTRLAAVNSINWTRVAAQSVYFAQAQAQLGRDRPIRFVVPTGNFGDALACYVASRCGLLNRFECVAAVNANDAMARLLSGMPLVKGETHADAQPRDGYPAAVQLRDGFCSKPLAAMALQSPRPTHSSVLKVKRRCQRLLR